MWPNFLHRSQLSAYLSTKHVAVNSNKNNILENSDNSIISPSSDATEIWQQSCARLESLLATNKNKSNTPITILVGSDLVRFLMLPSQQVMMNKQEKAAYAAAAFQEIYGANASDWEIKQHENAPNQPSIVAAIDKNLIISVNQIAAKNHFKLNSLQPYVMTAFNQSTQYFSGADTYLAIVEMNRLTLIFIKSGRYQQLRSHVISDDWPADFKKILLRESATTETACRDILVYSHKHKAQSLSVEGWTIKFIDQFKTHSTPSNNRFLKVAI